VHVHLVSVEVSVVGCSDTQVEAECLVVKNFNAMTHHRHLMQRRLSVKDYVIIILEMAFNYVVVLKMSVSPVLENRKIDETSICPLDELCSWPCVSSLPD
jgi:poly-beta-hydroxyalkanoate depolymerase